MCGVFCWLLLGDRLYCSIEKVYTYLSKKKIQEGEDKLTKDAAHLCLNKGLVTETGKGGMLVNWDFGMKPKNLAAPRKDFCSIGRTRGGFLKKCFYYVGSIAPSI